MLSSLGDRLASRLSAFGRPGRVGRFSSQKMSLVTQTVKCLSAMQKTWVQSLGRSPEEGNGNLCRYSCLGNSMDRECLVSYSPWGHEELGTTEVT